ncbi:MAG: T9SS type A sorting domain-containing protein [Ignavibacteriales bacterium]|nr:MAG: T9SS type A sorting domain-containing protein [Ignavibacteriales bacterium]
MRQKWIYQKIFLVVISLVITNAAYPQSGVSQSVFSSGGVTQQGGGYILTGTVGEAVTGIISGSSYRNTSGFWSVYSQITVTGIDDKETIPSSFRMEQNYPNPFNPSTKIRFSVPEKSSVSLKVYDVLGNEVAELVNEDKEAGWYDISFDASGFASGVYIYRVIAGNFISTKKMLMIK